MRQAVFDLACARTPVPSPLRRPARTWSHDQVGTNLLHTSCTGVTPTRLPDTCRHIVRALGPLSC
ncbi:MAG: hypothetical protein AVDCRST_MAG26-4369 [uncultured Chloroflexia bacterium]|uniref:Uncharacterized protein n=1 Tax=uncultured Chloroflexia bacterium TaxID=1672391 RepID=A0A6J4K3J1_9CHLR|nr:MAG: hypothetical protein AVDCRST_MAG26-4369 [uncultured Chloroflexia bacterium]